MPTRRERRPAELKCLDCGHEFVGRVPQISHGVEESSEWRNATEWRNGGPMPDSTFRTAKTKLQDKGRIWQDGDRYYSSDRNQTAIELGFGGQLQQHSTAAAQRAAVTAVDDSNGDEWLKREALGEMDDVPYE